MKISYPHVIENCVGEKIIFHSVQKEPDGDSVIVENFVTPGHGPLMHTRYSKEYDLPEIPKFIKKTVIPLTYMLGRILGKYKHFKDAPEPVT